MNAKQTIVSVMMLMPLAAPACRAQAGIEVELAEARESFFRITATPRFSEFRPSGPQANTGTSFHEATALEPGAPAAEMTVLATRETGETEVYEVVARLVFRGETTQETLRIGIERRNSGELRLSGSFSKTISGRNGTVTFDILLKQVPSIIP